ncbi:MAG: hypothetical protein O9345_18465 [Burkholderiaceae bacterium]|nr:hypothetical protein [Burkholderiales bacterium]MCZ8097550.1 hypothetical protein [Burkholderiales bacterium]MCZ8340107.1 hypothetical protein [Burkholderiaceae bacterium]
MPATTPLCARADRLLFAVFATCGAAAVALSLHFGGTVLALAVAIPLVAVAASLVAAQPGRPVTRLYVAIAVHHAACNAMQRLGRGVICLTEASGLMVALHASYVVVQSGLQIVRARRLERDSRLGAELERITGARPARRWVGSSSRSARPAR